MARLLLCGIWMPCSYILHLKVLDLAVQIVVRSHFVWAAVPLLPSLVPRTFCRFLEIKSWGNKLMRLRSPSARVLCCQRCAFQPFSRGYTVAAQSPSSQPNDVELPPRKKRPKTRISRWTDKQLLANFFNTLGKDLGVAQVWRSIDPSTKLDIELLKIIYYFVHILAIWLVLHSSKRCEEEGRRWHPYCPFNVGGCFTNLLSRIPLGQLVLRHRTKANKRLLEGPWTSTCIDG